MPAPADPRLPRPTRRELLRVGSAVLAYALRGRPGAAPALAALLPSPGEAAPAASGCSFGWQGTVLIDGDSLANWSVELEPGSTGSLALVPGLCGQAVQLTYDIGTGSYVQARYSFPQRVDLSAGDIFGVSLHGSGGSTAGNVVAVMFADDTNVVWGCSYDYNQDDRSGGLNQVDRWLVNLPIPKKQLFYFFTIGSPYNPVPINWARINRFWLVVKNRPGATGGSGTLRLDQLQWGVAAQWPRQTRFEPIVPDATAAAKAIGYILSQQKSTGLFLSWKEEPAPGFAWLYDQALVLLALTREGQWTNGNPTNDAARAATSLVTFLLAAQKPDGHWARGWNPLNGAERVDREGNGTIWVGDRAWAVLALAVYAAKAGDAAALAAAQRGADWLAPQIDANGKVVGSTEGTVDTWWAMIATSRFAEADRIIGYLLNETTVWDNDLRYWWRGANDPLIALDCATWLSAFARHPRVNQAARGLAALSFARRTLATVSDDGRLPGLDGQGPVSLWNEGIGQYVAAGGEDAATLRAVLLAQQHQDGSVPGSPDSWSTAMFGWLTTWSGLAPTAWLYFALTGLPFPYPAPPQPCAPRPPVGVTHGPVQNGSFLVTLTANTSEGTPANQLASLAFTRLANASVELPDGQSVSAPTTIPLPSRPTSTTFTVRRIVAGRAATVSFTVQDGCGAWKSFVGLGAGVP